MARDVRLVRVLVLTLVLTLVLLVRVLERFRRPTYDAARAPS